MNHVFVVASKGIPAQYGGFETFVENLTKRKMNPDIYYHVSCMNHEERHFEYNGADCFNVKLPLKGAPGRILHVSRALKQIEDWQKQKQEANVTVYILGCRIGPLLIPHERRLRSLGICICVNPDGLEWKRDKWNALAKRFLKYCERCLVLHSDLVICDSKNIEKYITTTYGAKVPTTYIAYGMDLLASNCSQDKLEEWYRQHNIKSKEYYLIVGRFVPENNYVTMIREFRKSKTNKDLVIITNVTQNKFYQKLEELTHFSEDSRVKFVGTVYDEQLLKKIREEAFAYIHGHEVGGTNPSLLEALGSTELNLLLDVGFNREVAEAAALYFDKTENSLCSVLNDAENMDDNTRTQLGHYAKEKVKDRFGWNQIIDSYEKLFLKM